MIAASKIVSEEALKLVFSFDELKMRFDLLQIEFKKYKPVQDKKGRFVSKKSK